MKSIRSGPAGTEEGPRISRQVRGSVADEHVRLTPLLAAVGATWDSALMAELIWTTSGPVCFVMSTKPPVKQ